MGRRRRKNKAEKAVEKRRKAGKLDSKQLELLKSLRVLMESNWEDIDYLARLGLIETHWEDAPTVTAAGKEFLDGIDKE